MADFLETLEERRVVPDVRPGDIRAALPVSPPERAEPFDRIFADFKETIVPGMTHWQHPGWFAYFPANSSPPSILGEMLTATLAAQCMSWQTSPAATELEQVVMEWMRQMLGLPKTFTGVIQDTASTATLVALLCARERITAHSCGERGAFRKDLPTLRVYASDQAHSSIPKGVKLAGYGLENLRLIESDTRFAMRADVLDAAIREDLKEGRRPACVVATVGTTSSGAIDPVPDIARLCREHGLWFHVDAAWAGSAAICPEHRSLLLGVDQADSFLFNPHKWLLTNFDCTAYFVKDIETLLHTFTTSPEYLRTAVDDEVVNYRDWQIQLGRRFRALKLWFVIRSYGVDGLREMIRRHVALANEFAEWLRGEAGFELLAPVSLALVCFRYRPDGMDPDSEDVNKLNEKLLAEVNASGEVHLTHTKLCGKYCIRMCVGQLYTERRHVERAWELLKASARELI
jgi:aromatic-L-amino-acid decarboxylase